MSSKDEKGMYAEFEDVFYVVKCVNPRENSEKSKYVKKNLNYNLRKI